MGAGLPPAPKRAAISQRIGTPLRLFNCPTRRPLQAWANGWGTTLYDCNPVSALGRSDYAANSGDYPSLDELFPGPPTLAQGDDPNYPWPDTSRLHGVVFQRSELRFSDITHGVSNTFFAGEKYLNPDNYATGKDPADNENLYAGADNDNERSTYFAPQRDRPGLQDTFSFGSVHRGGLNMAYCDGSVRFFNFGADTDVFRQAGNRN